MIEEGLQDNIVVIKLAIFFKSGHKILGDHLCGTALDLVALDKMDELTIFE